MAALTVKRIERLIYPVSFYRHKARHVKATCRILVDRFDSRVPATMEELLTLPGVGQKDRQSRPDSCIQEREEHLRGYARAPHFEPARMGEDQDSR